MKYYLVSFLCIINSIPMLIESTERTTRQSELIVITSKRSPQSQSIYAQLTQDRTKFRAINEDANGGRQDSGTGSSSKKGNTEVATKLELLSKSRRAKKGKTLKLGVFVDEIVYRNLHSLYADEVKINDVILGLINQVQAIYYQKSLGQKVTLSVVRLDIFKKQPASLHFEKELQMVDVEAFQVLTKFCNYQNEKKSNAGQWDMGIYFTGHDLFVDVKGEKSRGTMGLATIAGVCKAEHSCVIGEFTSVAAGDQPYLSSGFMAAYIMAHEMGHNLGMLHDGYGNECPKDGFLMSATRSFEGEVRWSECSAKAIRDLQCVNAKKRTVKRSKKIGDHMRFNLVPGQTWDANEQCRLLLKDAEAKQETPSSLSDACKSIKCVTRKRVGHFYAGPALDGTFCGTNKWCKSGECVSNVDEGLSMTIGNWSDWTSGPCTSGCLQNSKGIIRRIRHCNNPKPVNSEFCEGDDTEIKLCDDSSKCGSSRNSVKSEASRRCNEYGKLLSDISSEGGQMPFNKKKTWQACAVFCRTSTTGVWYTPRYDVNDAKTDTHLPEGTWCHNDGQQNYHCRHHDCIPESQF